MDAISAYASQHIWTATEIGNRETARLLKKNALAVQNGKMPAVNVKLSEESLRQAAESNARTFARQLEATAADGTAVSVQRIAGIYASAPDIQDGYLSTEALEGSIYAADFTDAAGNRLRVKFTGDITSALNADGTRSVYFSETNTTRTYGADGSYAEAEGTLLAADADAVHISTGGNTLVTGNGNNLIFVYGDKATIQAGAGNDDIRLAGGVNAVTIDTGDGGDAVSGSIAYDLDVALNSGNNTVNVQTLVGGNITAGNGNNVLTISAANAASITLDNSANTYTTPLLSG